jgi:hypothetical protein
MTPRKRKAIFYVLVALFFIISVVIVFYAQGWRFDVQTWRTSKVGAVFIRSFPDDAQIYLDKKPVKNESAFLSRGTLIGDLFPKTYQLELKAKGYDDWRENAAVSPSLVTEFKYAVLIPQNATTVAQAPVTSFFGARDMLMVQNENGAILANGSSTGKGTLIDESSDGSSVIIKNETSGRYSLVQLGNSTSTDLSALLLKSGASKNDVSNISFDPYDPGKIVAAGTSAVWLIDAAGKSAVQIAKTKTGAIIGGAVAAGPSFIAWTESGKSKTSSTIMIYDESAGELAASSTLTGGNNALKWVKGNLLGILQNDGELYLYDAGSRNMQKIADDVNDFAPTKDGSLIAALESRSLEIIPFTGNGDDYYRFNLPDLGGARRIFWYKDSTHLFVDYGDHVSFLDLKDANLVNFTTIAQGTAPFYDLDRNALYLIDPQKNLVRYDFPD